MISPKKQNISFRVTSLKIESQKSTEGKFLVKKANGSFPVKGYTGAYSYHRKNSYRWKKI